VISGSVLDPSDGQCVRMTTVITAPPPVRTSDMKCNADGARPLATRSIRPMGVTRIAQLTRPDGSARPLSGPNMVRNTPWLRYQLSSIRDRTVMAENSSPAKQSRKSRSSAPAAARIRPARTTRHCALSAAANGAMPGSDHSPVPAAASRPRS
jgi:hypothetical protein